MKKKKTDFAVIIYICLAALLILGIKYFDQIAGVALKLWNVAFPLILGVAVAYVINIIMVRVERIYFPKTKNRFVAASRRGVSIVVSLLLVAGIFSLVARLVLPELGKAFAVIGRNVPIFLEEAAVWLEKNNAGNTADMLKNVDWNNVMDKVADVAKSGFTSFVNSTLTAVGAVVGSVVNFFIGLIFGIYILSGKEKLHSQVSRIMHAYMKERTVARIRYIYRTANETFSSFIIGQCTEAVILGTLCTICLLYTSTGLYWTGLRNSWQGFPWKRSRSVKCTYLPISSIFTERQPFCIPGFWKAMPVSWEMIFIFCPVPYMK